MKLRLLLVPLVLGLGLLLAGCGGRKTETVTVTVTAGETTGSTTTSTEPSPETTAAVTELQNVMTDLGYYDGPIDGVYGDATTAGVKKMQEDLGVTADGVYGKETHDALKGKGKSIRCYSYGNRITIRSQSGGRCSKRSIGQSEGLRNCTP